MALDIGTLFAIPLAEKAFGFGQLVAWQNPIFYMVGYELKTESPRVNESAIEKARPILMGNFFDVLIRNGRWPIIKKMKIPNVPFPCTKVRIGDKFYVETWDREKKREATSEECAILPFRTNCSAIILENALKAHFGLLSWDSKHFDNLRAEAVTSFSGLLT